MKDIFIALLGIVLVCAIIVGSILLIVTMRVAFFALIGWLLAALMPGTINGAIQGLGLNLEAYQLTGLLGLISFVFWRPDIAVSKK